MKQVFLSSVCILLFGSLIAQDRLAYVEIKNEDNSSFKSTSTSTSTNNSHFINNYSSTNLPKTVDRMNHMVANFDLTNLNNYSESERYYYDVDFDEKNHSVKARYSQDGDLIHYEGQFKNVRLPSNLSKMVLKSYPKWAIVQNEMVLNYQKDQNEPQIVYTVTLQKDGRTKKITL